jgi:hypothetical protein
MPAASQPQPSPIELRRLSEFVDRTDEMRRFGELLESSEKHVMLVWGDPGMGKTSLRLRMVHECALRNLRKAEVDCASLRGAGYLHIMRTIRDHVGVRHFDAFSDYADYLTNPKREKLEVSFKIVGDVSVGTNAHIGGGGQVGAMTGIAVRDNMFVIPRGDLTVPEEERIVRSTDRFLEALVASAQEGPIVVFLDSVEKLTPDLESWLWMEILTPARDGRIAGAKFVLCSQSSPELDRDWRMSIEEAHLQPLALEHIEAYLAKRGVDEVHRPAVAMALAATTNGKVAAIAAGVDMFLELQRKPRAS